MENPRRRITVTALLIITVLASALLIVGRVEELTREELASFLAIVAGEDADGVYASVTEAANGTAVSLTGFIGSPTSYSDLLRVCNIGNRKLTLRLEVADVPGDGWPSVFNLRLARRVGESSLVLSLPFLTSSRPLDLEPGECAVLGVEVLVPSWVSAGEAASLSIRFTQA
ncbi:MAG: hypothetical protein QXF68_06550 [Thermofilaceae archaeon]